jgi:cell cycle checkpoint control protein RAD9A
LKQPLHTCIAIDVVDFENFQVEERHTIGISVKDFKAIVAHAETLRTSITTSYSQPAQPMRITYGVHGMQCKFVLMTIGKHRDGSATPTPMAIRTSERPSARVPAESNHSQPLSQALDQQRPAEPPKPEKANGSRVMPPPRQPASRSFGRFSLSQHPSKPSPPPPEASINQESLFLSDDEEDARWGEKNYEREEDELGWGDNFKVSQNLLMIHLTYNMGRNCMIRGYRKIRLTR